MHADRHHSVHRRHHRGGGQQGQVVDGRPEFPVLVRRVVRPDRSLVRDPRGLHTTTTSGRSRGRRLRHAISSSCTTSGHVFSGFTALGHDLLAVPFPVTWSTVARGWVVRRCACVSTDHWLYALTVLSFTTAEERQFSPRPVTLHRAQR